MANAPINEVVNNAFRDTVENWKKEGLSDEELARLCDLGDQELTSSPKILTK